MKKKKIIFAASFLLAAVAVGVAANPIGKMIATSGATEDCLWHHYNAVEGSYLDNGSKEYWVCCTHNDSVFVRPTSGTIVESGTPSDEFVKSLTPDDERYDIKKTDHVVAIKPNIVQSSAGKHTFATRDKIAGLQSISFDAKWENMTQSGWLGFGHSSNIATADIYTGMKTISLANDGQWHNFNITFDGVDEYAYFIAAAGEFNDDATVLLKNIEVTGSAGVLKELADGTGNLFRSYFNSDYDELIAPGLSFETRGADGSNNNMAMKLDVNGLNASTGKLNVVSKLNYRGIKKLTVRYKATGGAKAGNTPWGGFAISATPDNCDIYSYFSCARAAFSPVYDGEWHDVELSVDGDGYLFFAAAIGEYQEGTTFYFDSIKIGYYWNNCSTTESFNQDCMLFRNSAAVRGNVWTTVAVE